MTREVAPCRASIARNSKSFALAAKLLPRQQADEAAILYAWCRRADDTVDLATNAEARASLRRLHQELDSIYGGEILAEPILRAFQSVVRERALPRTLPEELLAGLEMDCELSWYETRDDLLRYCFRVAGVVGLMMCPTLEVRDPEALRRAAHLGMAMQITNICRDVLEDWDMGRLYVPEELLRAAGVRDLHLHLGRPFPAHAVEPMARAVQALLREADAYYASGDCGIAALPWRTALSIRTARRVYAAIGRRVERRGCDVTLGRAVVPLHEKLLHVARAALGVIEELPARGRGRAAARAAREERSLWFPEEILPCLQEAAR
ncbi:MAG: phytoene/squalene synthase family protein [Planctomycetes bacterium]|nr:phytoene/squalene synthase family protein [Planctomycetota bacterium]